MLKRSHIKIQSEAAWKGICIAHLSDFHNCNKTEAVLAALKDERPDVIAVTGDLIDRRRQGTENALALAEGCIALAPVVFSMGNHEARSSEFPAFERALTALGVCVLKDKSADIVTAHGILPVYGMSSPVDVPEALQKEHIMERLAECGARVLLSHHPEYMPLYAAAKIPLVLAGHAHGGQWRLPMGLYAPGQGLFPKYTRGLYRLGDTQMEVSAGIGNSSFPLRINDPPQVVFLELT